MHVQINDGDFQHLPRTLPGLGARVFRLRQPGCYCHVVEHTKPAALVGAGVVRATRQIGRHAVALHRAAHCGHRGSYRAP